jgi:hypothetical protein
LATGLQFSYFGAMPQRLRTLLPRSFAVVGLMAVVVLLVAWQSGRVPTAHAYHSSDEIAAFRDGQDRALAYGQNTYFMASGNCEGCHGHDPSGFAMVTQDGLDVNVVDDWRSSIMANSARDPFTFGYNLPKNWISKVGLQNARVYCSGTNLLTWAAYREVDPETNQYSTRGWETPFCKVITFGLELGF